MKLYSNQMTAQFPSGSAMPACGHAFATGLGSFAATTVVRERRAAVIADGTKGDMGLTAYVPGIRAWSPPTS